MTYWSLIELIEILCHQLLLLSNKLCACLAARRRHAKSMSGKWRVRLANLRCWAPKPGGKVVVVVVARVMVMRCGGGIENRRGALASRRNRRRALVAGGSSLGGGVVRFDVSDD